MFVQLSSKHHTNHKLMMKSWIVLISAVLVACHGIVYCDTETVFYTSSIEVMRAIVIECGKQNNLAEELMKNQTGDIIKITTTNENSENVKVT